VFTATLLRLFFLGQHLSERVKCPASYAPLSFWSTVFKNVKYFIILYNIHNLLLLLL
jgi:hypothetical protein